MTVVARFFVSSLTTYANQPTQVDVKMLAVCRGEHNKEWAKYTPSGELRMVVNNPEASAQFELGKEYELRFALADSSD